MNPFASEDQTGPEIEEIEWFDGWCEAYQELLDAQDYAGVIKLCEDRLERNPADAASWEALSYAHLSAGDPERAIAVVQDRYRADPENDLYQAVIADALRAQDKPLESFPWIQPPRVVRLDFELLSSLHRWLKPKRKPRHVCDLWIETLARGYPFFRDEDLLAALQKDDRFRIEEPERMRFAGVSAR